MTPAEKREYNRAYYAANKKKFAALNRSWREANLEHDRQRSRQRYLDDPQGSAARARAWDRAHPNEVRARVRKWQDENRTTVRASNRASLARRRAQERLTPSAPVTAALIAQRIAYYGARCWMCSAPADVIDHVKPLSRGGLHIAANLRPACRSCNARKHAKWYGPSRLDIFLVRTAS